MLPNAIFAQYNGGNGRGDASIEASGLVLIINENILPSDFALLQNYPNPAKEETLIPIILPERSQVRIVLYDILGKQVKSIIDKSLGQGKFSFKLNTADLREGLYFYRMTAGAFSATRSMVIKK